MRLTRGLVLLIAAGFAIGAGFLVRKTMTVLPPGTEQAPPPEVEILVLGRTIAAGEIVRQADLRWQAWPASALPSNGVQRRRGGPSPRFEPALARYPLIEGEPVADAKLIKPGDGSIVAALIAPGKRAVAVPVREESAVGGLVQPNDRVDLLWTPKGGDFPATRPAVRTILRGIKVLAIGTSVQAKGRNTEGRTATLELTPEEARIAASAKASGEISLALIPTSDVAALDSEHTDREWESEPTPVIRVMKFGRQPAGQPGIRGR